MVKLISEHLKVFTSTTRMPVPTCHIMRIFVCKHFNRPNWLPSCFPIPWWAYVEYSCEQVTSHRRHEGFCLSCILHGQDSGNNSEVAMELSIFVSWIATMWGWWKSRRANSLMLLMFMLANLCQMKKTQFSFLLSGDQIYFDFLSLTAHQKKNRKSWKSHILGKSRYSLYFPKFHTEIPWWKSIHCEPTSHNCHTELPCDLSEQHRCIIHSLLCSLCNTKIHFLIPVLTVYCLQVWRMMRESMGCRFTIYSLFMDIQNPFLDIQKSVEYWISIIRFLDIQRCILRYP